MKYLKMFESSAFYTRVTSNDWAHLVNGTDVLIDMNPYEYDKLESSLYSICREKKYTYSLSKYYTSNNGIYIRANISNKLSMNIYKLEDEWYYVYLYYIHDFYKCDQLEGLLKFLEDII